MTDAPFVVGRDALIHKTSAVDVAGSPRLDPIEGVKFRAVRPVPHEDGTLAEIAKTSWPEIDQPIVQVHLTTTLPGRIRAWGLHEHSTDRLFVVAGLVSIAVYDGRLGSPSFGALNLFQVSDRNPSLIIIPPNLYHGWRNFGTSEAFIVNMPSQQYDYEQPDALDLPYDSERASDIVPFRW